MIKTLIIPDCHHPSVDTFAWDLVKKVGKSIKPDALVVLGDFGDFASVTSHAKNAEQRNYKLIDELAACNTALRELEELCDERTFIAGNHEDRVARYLNERCPEMVGLWGTDIATALHLETHGWTYVPYRDYIHANGIYFTHDTGSAGLNAHRSSLTKFNGSVCIGHTHRLAYECRRNIQGDVIQGAMLGWLGDRAKCAGYMHGVSADTDWTLGFGIAYTEDDEDTNQNVHIQPIPISGDYTCVVEGKLYK